MRHEQQNILSGKKDFFWNKELTDAIYNCMVVAAAIEFKRQLQLGKTERDNTADYFILRFQEAEEYEKCSFMLKVKEILKELIS